MPRTATPEGEGKRVPLNMRTTREARARLEAAAAASGRSLAQEVETRVNDSFTLQSVDGMISAYNDLLGGKANIGFFAVLGKMLSDVSKGQGIEDWTDPDADVDMSLFSVDLADVMAAYRMREVMAKPRRIALVEALEAYRPKGGDMHPAHGPEASGKSGRKYKAT